MLRGVVVEGGAGVVVEFVGEGVEVGRFGKGMGLSVHS